MKEIVRRTDRPIEEVDELELYNLSALYRLFKSLHSHIRRAQVFFV